MAFTPITVTRRYLTADFTPAKGTVRFTPTAPMVNGDTVVAASRVGTLDAVGDLTLVVAANNDPATTPIPVSYEVREDIDGQPTRTYFVTIPYNAAGGTVALSSLLTAQVPPVVTYPAPGPAGPNRIATATDFTATGASVGKVVAVSAASGGSATAFALTTQPFLVLAGVGDGTADDTAAINAQLAAVPAGSHVRGVPGSNYRISAPLVLRPGGNITLDLTGCTVTMAAASNCNFLQNAAYTAVRAVADAVTTLNSTTVTSATAAFTSADVGRMVSISGAGPIGVGPGREVLYGKITTVTNATTVTIATSTSGVVGAHAAVTAATLSVFNRDARIVIRGGLWARGTNDGVNNNRHNLLFRRVDDLLVENVTVTSSSGKYGISLGDVTDFRVRDPQFDTASDGVHILGPATGGSVSGIRGTLGDDAAGITACDFTAYTDTVGDVVGVEITDVVASTPTTALLKFTSAPGVLLDQVHVRGAQQLATSQPAFAFAADTGVLNVGTVELSDIVGRGYVLAGTVGTLRLRNWRWTATANANVGLYVQGTVGTLDIGGVAASSAFDATHMLRIDAGAVVTHLMLNEVRFQGGTASYLVQHADGTSQVSRAMLSNVRRDCTGTGGGLYQASISGVALSVLMLNNVYVDAGAWFADLITATAIHVANCHGNGTAKTFNIRAGGNCQVYGSYILGLAGANAGTLRARTLGFQFDVAALALNANDMAYNTNAALTCGVGPVVCNGTLWKHLYSGLTT